MRTIAQNRANMLNPQNIGAVAYCIKLNTMVEAKDGCSVYGDVFHFTNEEIIEEVEKILTPTVRCFSNLKTARELTLAICCYNWVGWFYHEIKMQAAANVCFTNYERLLNIVNTRKDLSKKDLQKIYDTID